MTAISKPSTYLIFCLLQIYYKKNPDKRCEIIKDYAKEHFSDNTVLKFALAVEQG